MDYLLYIISLSYDNYSEDFYIGLFETEQQAEDIAKHYLKNIKGFCDFPCTYRIVKKDVIGDFNSRISDYLWTVQGWNTNEEEIPTGRMDCNPMENRRIGMA